MSSSSLAPTAVAAPAGPSAPSSAKPDRLVSLDALRGFDMFWILGGDALAYALAKTWKIPPFEFLAAQLDHKEWAGIAAYDLIFPLFVFIAGVSTAFSLRRLIAQKGRGRAALRVLLRGTLLFAIGFIYGGGLTNPWPDVRIFGPVPRIAVAYTFAGLLFCFLRPRALVAMGVALLVGYWALLTYVPIRDVQLDRQAMNERYKLPPGRKGDHPPQPKMEEVRKLYAETTTMVTGRYEPGLNLTNHLDFEYLGGRKYDLYWDPEGLLSSLPAIASCLMGVLTGLMLLDGKLDPSQKLKRLLIAGVVALALGWLWHLQFPVVKKIWTSSFVLVGGGYSLVLLGAFYYIVDIRRWRGWCTPFIWIGMNPITLYVIGGILNYNRQASRFLGGDVRAFFDKSLTDGLGGVVVAVGGITLMLTLARFLYKREIFLRL